MADAWIIGHRESDKGRLLRILDLTTGAKVRVYDYPRKEVYQAICNDKLTLRNVIHKEDADTGENIISEEYYTIDLDKPDIADKRVLLYAEKLERFTYNLVLADQYGNIEKIDAYMASNIPLIIDSIVNVKVDESKRWLCFRDNTHLSLSSRTSSDISYWVKLSEEYKTKQEVFRNRVKMVGGLFSIIPKSQIPLDLYKYATYIENYSNEPKEHAEILKMITSPHEVKSIASINIPANKLFKFNSYECSDRKEFMRLLNVPRINSAKPQSSPILDNIIKLLMINGVYRIPDGSEIISIDKCVRLGMSMINRVGYIDKNTKESKECLLARLSNGKQYAIGYGISNTKLYNQNIEQILRLYETSDLFGIEEGEMKTDPFGLFKHSQSLTLSLYTLSRFRDNLYSIVVNGVNISKYEAADFIAKLLDSTLLLGYTYNNWTLADRLVGNSEVHAWYFNPLNGDIADMKTSECPALFGEPSSIVSSVPKVYTYENWMKDMTLRDKLSKILGQQWS